MRLLEALDAFALQLEADGRSIHTRDQYARHIRLLARWLGDKDEITSIAPETLARFLTSPQARMRVDGAVKKATSANALRTSLRVFFKWCADAEFVEKSPARLVRRARCGPPPPRALNDAELRRLEVSTAHARGVACERDRMFLRLLLATGIRLGSALALDVGDIDFERGELWLHRTKGDRPIRVFVGAGIREELRRFVGVRVDGPLFTAQSGARLGRRHVQRRIVDWLRASGINRGASTHSLRHTFATGLYRRTGDILVVKESLAHRSIVSTLVYARADESRLRALLG